MRRRLDRDRNRIHQYHSDLHLLAQTKLAALTGASGEKADNDRKREMLRIAAIEREYAAKLGDLRHNYALRVSVEWVSGIAIVRAGAALPRAGQAPQGREADATRLAPVGPPDGAAAERLGAGQLRSRLVCDDQLHITEPAAQAPCPSCGKAWCRACHPSACPRCGEVIKVE